MDDYPQIVRTHPAPPADFDPHTAPNHVLRQHGLPDRPNPEREPLLHAAWKKTFAEPLTYVEAELEVDPYMAELHASRSAGTNFSLDGWSGIQRDRDAPTDFASSAVLVHASWVVPEVLKVDPAGDKHLTVAFWIGIDGDPRIGELLQAGIAAVVKPYPVIGELSHIGAGEFVPMEIEWYAWVEWFTGQFKDPPKRITNFPVVPGDTVTFTVSGEEPGFGMVTMANLTRHHISGMTLQAHPGLQTEGESVEWIVEGTSADLPKFTPITFTDCLGKTKDGKVFHVLPGGIPLNMTGDHQNNPLTQSYASSPTSVVVKWIAFD
jgi:hypothetical protein